jgi:hypothetical protein
LSTFFGSSICILPNNGVQKVQTFQKIDPLVMTSVPASPLRAVGMSENHGVGWEGYVIGIICPPGWNRVNRSAKIWGLPASLPLPVSLALSRLHPRPSPHS